MFSTVRKDGEVCCGACAAFTAKTGIDRFCGNPTQHGICGSQKRAAIASKREAG